MIFSPPKPETFGMDISDLSLKIAKVEKKGKISFLTTLGKKIIPENLIEKGIIKGEKAGELAKIIKSAISEVKGKKIKTKYAVCSLPEENSFIKVIKIPRVEEDEIEEIVKWQIEPNFPVKLNEVYFDWQLVNPAKTLLKDRLMLATIAVVPRRIVDSYLSVFKKAGIEPLAFEVESMAVVRSLILNSFSPHPIIILDMGKCGTCLTVFSGNTILFTSHIGIAGQDFDNAIARELKIGLKEAEDFKKEIGLAGIKKKWKTYHIPVNLSSEAEKKLMQSSIIKRNDSKNKELESKIDLLRTMKEERNIDALTPVLTDLIEQVQHYIRYFKDFRELEYVPDGRIGDIILCGGEANIIGLTDFFSNSLKIPVKVGNPLINISYSSNLFDEDFKKEALAYTTAIGLAMREIQ